MYRYVIASSKNGQEVHVNLISSVAGKTINRQPHLLQLIKGIIMHLKLTGPRVVIEQDMGRVIGNSDVVTTNEKDTVFYAQPQKMEVFSRYVKNRSVSPSSKLCMVFEKDEAGGYELTSARIGSRVPPFPGAADENDQSKAYWETHALVEDSQVIQSKTITKISPY